VLLFCFILTHVFVDAFTGFVVSDDSIWRTTDNGASWTRVFNHTGVRAVALYGDERAIAVGEDGFVARIDSSGWHAVVAADRTTIAPTMWTTQEWSSTQLDGLGRIHLQRVVYPSISVGTIAVGTNGILLKSADYGATWTKITTNTIRDLNSIVFEASPIVSYAVGNVGTIVRSVDSANSYQVMPSPTTSNLYGITTTSITGTVVAVGNKGTIIRTTDAGASWTVVSSGTTASLMDVRHIPIASGVSNVIVAVGEDWTIIVSADLGVTWTYTQTPSSEPHHYLRIAQLSTLLSYATARYQLVDIRAGTTATLVDQFFDFNNIADIAIVGK
jgi:photosystem II stability/assembly factor-like uncharacterized protein